MTREDFRRELGDAFDSISGSPSPALSDRVRSALLEAPERHSQVWIAALAAAVIAVILVGVLLVGNPLNRPATPGGHGTTTPSTSPAPSSSPNPSPTPSDFNCDSASAFITQKSPPPLALIDGVRTGTHAGYDRLTIEFENGQPSSIELRPQTGTSFTRDGIGDTVKLAGKDGLLIRIKDTDGHSSYSGPTDIRTGYSGLLEMRQVGDFEGTVQWALGLAKPACYRASIVPAPVRLVIDIQTG